MSVVDDVKQRIDIVDLIAESVPLKKAGRNYKGLCPFHQEKTPSFVVFPDTQSWHCFGSCGEGGDAFSFVQKREGVDFGEALRILAERAGVRLQPESEEATQEAKERDRLQAILEAAAAYYSKQLAAPAGEAARSYLAKRGVGQEIAAQFRLGYSPNAWHALSMALISDGYSRQEIAEAGLIIEKKDGGYYDRFRHRLMFPIADSRGRVLGFGARSLDGSEPKYLNSPQTRLFDKGKLLYGLHLARQAIMATETVVIVEGYMDVIAAHEAGYRNVVAGMGTAISEAQLQSLARLGRRFVLALDADSAGNAAALRGLAVATEALQGEATPTFEGGFLRFEQQLKAEIRVAILPEGLDPDDIIRRDHTAWEKLIAEAMSLVDYYFAAALAEEDLSDAKSKSRFARRLLPVLAAVSDPFERAHYIERLARHLQVDAAVVERELAVMRGAGGNDARRKPTTPATQKTSEPFGLEEYALRFLLHHQDALAAVDQALADAGLEALAAADFLDAANRSLFLALRAHGNADRLAFRAALDRDLRQLFDRIESSWATAPEADEQFLWHDGITSSLRLRKKRFENELRLLQLAIRDAEEAEEQGEYRQAVERARRQLDLLTEVLASRSWLKASK